MASGAPRAARDAFLPAAMACAIEPANADTDRFVTRIGYIDPLESKDPKARPCATEGRRPLRHHRGRGRGRWRAHRCRLRRQPAHSTDRKPNVQDDTERIPWRALELLRAPLALQAPESAGQG